MLIESIKMSWQNILNNKIRSCLTMLGIVIGTASIIALITTVQGATEDIKQKIQELGVNKIMINVTGTPIKQGLFDSDLKQIAALDNIGGVSPTVTCKTSIKHETTVIEDVLVQGKNDVYFKENANQIKSGRPLSMLDLDNKNQVAVIGRNIVNKLFFGVDPIGREIRINGINYTIIGTLNKSSVFGINSNNDTVIIPYTTALRSMGQRSINNLDVYLKDTEFADETAADIKGVLSSAFNYKEDAFSVFNMGEMINSFESIMTTMSLLLAGIAAISLVVGGIGIMNMMLVSVTERTAEIGLRKAVGATPGRIQMQFLTEAVLLSVFGGIFGLAAGAILAYIATVYIGVSFSLSAWTLFVAVGFSAFVGVVFGLMPARKASQLNPIEALRSL